MNTRFGLAALISALLSASVASAADIAPVYKAPPAAPQIYNWGGFYLGGNAGLIFGGSGGTYTQTPGNGGGFSDPLAVSGFSRSFSPTGTGATIGGQAGFNFQVSNWVFGVETDLQVMSPRGVKYSEAFKTFQDRLDIYSEEKWFGTTRGRLGWAANNWLFYGTGGFAYGSVYDEVSRLCNLACNRLQTAAASGHLTGWTAGGGVEYALSSNAILGIEYLYVDLGSNTVDLPSRIVPGSSFAVATNTVDHSFQVVRVKLNIKFDYGKSPVVAKY